MKYPEARITGVHLEGWQPHLKESGRGCPTGSSGGSGGVWCRKGLGEAEGGASAVEAGDSGSGQDRMRRAGTAKHTCDF